MRYLFYLLCCLLISCGQHSKDQAALEPTSSDIEEINPMLEESMNRGAEIYNDFCMQCHMGDGKGITGTFPPLADSDWLTNKVDESIRAVKYGQTGEIVVNGATYDGIMVTMGLSNEEIADVMNYIMNSWSNRQKEMITPERVSKITK